MKFLYSCIFFIVFTISHISAQEHSNHAIHRSTHNDMVPDKQHGQHGMTHNNHASMMHGMYGTYPMSRESSGTDWVPDSSPQQGIIHMHKQWMFMMYGYSYTVADKQTGPRGGKKIFDENMFMFLAQREFEKNVFAFRSMFSLEPATVGKCGYPLLLQTGETCDGKTPLIDRQHPHDLFMELALVNTLKINSESSTFLYFGLPGEPALGPPVYIMRFSSEYIPETPIGHHWMDATHITFGVLTIGLVHKNLKFELCSFTGREPDQHRFNFDKPRFDSFSCRLSFNPTQNIALQASYGFIKSPEQLEPDIDIHRLSMSALYNRAFNDNNIQIAAIFGLNKEKPGNTLPAFLLEATLELHKKHVLFSRFETVTKDDLFMEPNPLAHTMFNVQKFTLGYIYEIIAPENLKWGIGGLIDIPFVPSSIKNNYKDSRGYMLFLQVRLM